MLKTRTILFVAAAVCLGAGGALAAGDEAHNQRHEWSFGGMFGQYDKHQLQRGFQVYKEVCSTCHGLNRIAFRNLAQPGGPEFPEDAVRALAKEYQVAQPPNDDGKVEKGPAKLSDHFPPLYANEKEARSIHNGALPPDLSVIARARGLHYEGPWYLHPWSMFKDIVTSFQEGGADYIVDLMKGYGPVPSYKHDDKGRLVLVTQTSGPGVMKCVSITHGENGQPDQCNKLADGMNYNATFPGHQIAMVFPFAAHSKDSPQIKYQDGTPETVEQYAKDVAAFLSWASDPTLNQRKQLGWMVIFYLLITTVLLYVAKRRVWSGIAH